MTAPSRAWCSRDVAGGDRPVPPRGGPRPPRRPLPVRPLPGAGRCVRPRHAVSRQRQVRRRSRRRCMPRRDDIRRSCLIGYGADRDRPGGGVRLLRRPGVQGAARRRLRGRARQLQPGHDHDRPRVRPPHLRRAADPGLGGADHRARAAGRAAAHARRPDGAQPRLGAPRGEGARALRGGADRGRLRGDPPRRGPRGLPRDDGGRRPPGPVVRDRAQRRRGGAGAGRRAHRAARDRAARVHAGRRRGRRGADRHRAAPGRLRGPRGEPDQPGAGGGVGARLGRVRARGDARPQRQRGRHLLDRERRPDGRPHRGQRHRGSSPDAHRSPLPGAARPGPAGDPGRRGGDRRLEHPVRGQPEHAARWS